MPERIAEYVEFRLLDPAKMTEGLQGATVMTIGVLLSGAPVLIARQSPRAIGAAVNRHAVQFAHTPEGRTDLASRAIVGTGRSGPQHFYYCARCTGSLTPTHCGGTCRQRYTPARDIAFNLIQPVLPIRVAAYMMEQGHRFEVLP
jgi:hypothetical protein